MARAYEKTRKEEDDLRKAGKMPMALPLRVVGREPIARINADIYISRVKEEQLVKLAKTFKVPSDITFHITTLACHPS